MSKIKIMAIIIIIGAFLMILLNIKKPKPTYHCTEMHINQITVCVEGEIE
jgi:hypothetical protein